MKKRKKIAKSKKPAKKTKVAKKAIKKQKPKKNKGKIKLKIIQVEDSSHTDEKISRPRGRPKGKKKKVLS